MPTVKHTRKTKNKYILHASTHKHAGHHNRESVTVDSKMGDKHMEKHDPGDGKYIPKFKIINSPGSASVVMYLKEGQTVYDQHGCLNYCDSSLKVKTQTGGIMRGLVRALFTSESFFMTYYTGMRVRESVASFASFLPGDLIAIRIKPGESYVMTSYGLVCATENIVLGTKFRFRNVLGGGGMFITEAKVDDKSNSDGMIWVASYGGFERLTVEPGESIKIDHGLFCVAKSQYNYELTTMGGLKSTFFSGEGFMMKFHGPCEIYVHCRNVNHFIHFIEANVVKNLKQSGGRLLNTNVDPADEGPEEEAEAEEEEEEAEAEAEAEEEEA